MKKLILTEDKLNNLKDKLIKESFYSQYVENGKDFLDKNFMKAEYENDGKKVGIFIKLDRGMPTKKSVWKQDVLDELDREFYNKIKNNTERKGFISQLLDDWYNNRISKFGSLTNYNF